MLLNSNNTPATQYFVRLANGTQLGPYTTREAASASAATIPLREDEPSPQIVPMLSNGQQFLFG